ncbi:MAG: tRNA pseudouridine synthase A [Spirochaetia bacterium]|nr:tRNA pseudouridine synthase A [Spirochaetia bacterium]
MEFLRLLRPRDLPFNTALVLQYDGTRYAGFQRQKNGISVQELLEKAIAIALRENVRISCSGRTDSGVHATGQVAGFRSSIPVTEPRRFLFSLNGLLPPDIAIRRVIPVAREFDPRFSCLAREYEFLYWVGGKTPYWPGKAWCRRFPFNIEALNAELLEILGERNFGSLTPVRYVGKATVRYLETANLSVRNDPFSGDPHLVVLSVRGNAFLHNMIRILAGCIAARSLNKIGSIAEVVAATSRFKAGPTAPPHALYFKRALYAPGSGEGLETVDWSADHPLNRIHARGIQRHAETGRRLSDVSSNQTE